MKFFGVVVFCPCPKNGVPVHNGDGFTHYSDMLFRCFLTKILSSPPMIAFELMQQWCDEKNSSLSPDMLWQLLGDLWSCQAVTSMSNPLLLTNHKTADQSKFNTVISICWKTCRRSKFSLCLRTTVHWKVGRNLQGGPAMMSHQVALRKPPYGGWWGLPKKVG